MQHGLSHFLQAKVSSTVSSEQDTAASFHNLPYSSIEKFGTGGKAHDLKSAST
jgi:hypothetical protein